MNGHRLQVVVTSLALTASLARAADVPSTPDVSLIRALPTQHNGRFPPLDTLCRDLVETITGTQHFNRHDPVRLVLAWTFNPDAWMDTPLIPIRNASLRTELQLPVDQTVFSYRALIRHRPLMEIVAGLDNRPRGRKMNPLESKADAIYEQLVTLQSVFNGSALPLVPAPDSVITAWRAISDVKPGESPQLDAVRAAWSELGERFVANDAAGFAQTVTELQTALAVLPAPYRPGDERMAVELRYNRLQPYRLGWQALLTGLALAIVAALLSGSRVSSRSRVRRTLDILSGLALLLGFGVLSYGLSLRWAIAGRLPAANMFESLLFLSWGAAAFAIVAAVILALAQRGRVVTITATAMATIALFLADVLPLDHYIRPIAPVLLDTIWMSIHVPIIMVSYAVLAVAVAIAHAQLVLMAVAPRRTAAAAAIDRLHYWYVFVGAYLLLAGIITGSMWGASSWGRYWGWDPKEVWSLIAFLAYMAILHVRIDQERTPVWTRFAALGLGVAVFAWLAYKLQPFNALSAGALALAAVASVIFVVVRGPFATALKSILAFWLIIMTYVGVNFVLGTGLHSYAFGTGAVVRYMFRTGGADLALIAICTVIYLVRAGWRHTTQPPPLNPHPAPAPS